MDNRTSVLIIISEHPHAINTSSRAFLGNGFLSWSGLQVHLRCNTGNIVRSLASLAGEGQSAIINISASNSQKRLQDNLWIRTARGRIRYFCWHRLHFIPSQFSHLLVSHLVTYWLSCFFMSLKINGYGNDWILVRRVHKGRVRDLLDHTHYKQPCYWVSCMSTPSCNRSAVTILLAVDIVLLGSRIYVCVRNTSVIGLGQESFLHRQPRPRQIRPLSASASSVSGVVVTSNAGFLTRLSHPHLFI